MSDEDEDDEFAQRSSAILEPHHQAMMDAAEELAEVRVSSLLQVFAMPDVDEDLIHKMLKDAVANSYRAGFANGWDTAMDQVSATIDASFRYTPRSR